jgi:hypothetical protein
MTPGRIAREAAEGLVSIESLDHPGKRYVVFVGGEGNAIWHNAAHADEGAARLRDKLAASHQAAVERALCECPVPGGLGGERLAEMREEFGAMEAPGGISQRLVRQCRDLLAHIEHLTRALHDCGQDGTASVWAAGYEAGRAAGLAEGLRRGAGEQWRSDLRAVTEEGGTIAADTGELCDDAVRVIRAIEVNHPPE